MYDPTIGQFLSEDPTEFDAGDPNLKRMVGNNVVNLVDPFGLQAQRPNAATDKFVGVIIVDDGDIGKPGDETIANAEDFKKAALKILKEKEGYVIVKAKDVREALAGMATVVKTHGKIDVVVVMDHSVGKEIGSNPDEDTFFDKEDAAKMREYLDIAAQLWLLGCWVGQHDEYCRAIADASGATVVAPRTRVLYGGDIMPKISIWFGEEISDPETDPKTFESRKPIQ